MYIIYVDIAGINRLKCFHFYFTQTFFFFWKNKLFKTIIQKTRLSERPLGEKLKNAFRKADHICPRQESMEREDFPYL